MRNVMLVVFMTASVLGAKAQEKKFSFGAKAGLNLAKYHGEDAEYRQFKAGAHFGLVADLRFTPHLGIQPELLFSMQGSKGEYSGFDGEESYTGEFTDKVNYINIPILFKYNDLGVKGLSAGFGPQVEFLLSAKEEYTENYGGEYFSDEFDFKDTTNGVDFSLAISAEYELPIGVFFQLRYTHGLTNINDESDFVFKNSVVQFSGGYKFL